MLRCFIGETRHMKSPHCYIDPSLMITIGYLICTVGIGNIHLNTHQIGCVVKCQLFYMLILDFHFVVISEISSECCQS